MVFALIIAVLPSLVWLFFFLQEDQHPEPNRLVLKVFFFGAVSSLLAIFFERALLCVVGTGVQTSCSEGVMEEVFKTHAVVVFAGIALIEEYVKFLAVELSVLGRPDFDEPLDAMLYMVIAALGFAAVENILFLTPAFPQSFLGGIQNTAGRFIGATLLHALASAFVGYFLSLSYFWPTHRRLLLVIGGLAVGTFLHFLFNFFILIGATALIILMLGGMALTIFLLFQRLKKSGAFPTGIS